MTNAHASKQHCLVGKVFATSKDRKKRRKLKDRTLRLTKQEAFAKKIEEARKTLA